MSARCFCIAPNDNVATLLDSTQAGPVELLLPVLDSVPPGEVAPPVEDPAVIPKCE